MALMLQELPTEILDLVLRHLPLSDLLSFAKTSKTNYSLSVQALTSLDLAVFPRRIHSLLAFFDASNGSDDEEDSDDSEEDPPISKYWSRRASSDKSLYQIGLTTPNSNANRPSFSRSSTPPSVPVLTGKQRKALHQGTNSSSSSRSSSRSSSPPTPLSLRTAEITAQNTIANTVLASPSLDNLRNLSLRLYDLSSQSLATTLATQFPSLNSLSLEFSHPYIHDTTLPAKFWREIVPQGSPIWNIFAGIGEANASALRLHNLRSLKLNRSGITSFQLRHWVEANPELRELRLSLCRGVDIDFVNWLAEYQASGRGKLESIRLTDCALLEAKDDSDLDWITILAGSGLVHDLSLRGCKSVKEDIFLRLASVSKSSLDLDAGRAEWKSIPKLVSPKGVVVKRRAATTASANANPESQFGVEDIPLVQRSRLGSVSPALTVSDGMVGSAGGYFGKIEVDPAMAL